MRYDPYYGSLGVKGLMYFVCRDCLARFEAVRAERRCFTSIQRTWCFFFGPGAHCPVFLPTAVWGPNCGRDVGEGD